jgi:Holliday junction resolvase RusA-like endonuclease
LSQAPLLTEEYDPWAEPLSVKFRLRFVPPKTTAQQKRVTTVGGKPMLYKNKKGLQADNDYLVMLKPYVPEFPLDGALKMEVTVAWPYLKSDTQLKANRDRQDLVPHTSKPDLDNWLKQFTDALVKLRFIEDDSQIVELTARKYRSDKEVGISCQITQLS